jgi:hypothetical protein
MVSEKNENIGLKWHFLDHVEQGTIKLMYLPIIDQMMACMFIKPLPGSALTRHRSAVIGGTDPMQGFTP